MQELLRVVPFVQGAIVVQPFVALQSHQFAAPDRSQRLSQFRLADTGRPFEQERAPQRRRQMNDYRELVIGNVVLLSQSIFHFDSAGETATGHGTPFDRGTAHVRLFGSAGYQKGARGRRPC